MAETVAVNFRILPETVEKLDRLSREMFRGKGDLVDFLVAEAFKQMSSTHQPALAITNADAEQTR